jgi:hypothetical protein
MGKTLEKLTPDLCRWIGEQRIFFVSTAPRSDSGHVNCSPKGGDTLRILNHSQVAYLDFTGSGIETIAHLQENGRIVVMFCAFAGPPKIVRLHGKGEVIYPVDADFSVLAALFAHARGARAIIRVNISRVSDSCGYSVPLYEFVRDRDALDKWVQSKTADELAEYRQKKNTVSIDGIRSYDSRPESY